jgi:diguanylate cyclase (GGDEF)-like protein/PAS domain S-box-containing protein
MDQGVPADGLLQSADHAATAALRELPEALVIVFDRDLKFVLAAGQALERLEDVEAWSTGQPVADAFPAEIWHHFQPLFSSALEGETRTREVWTASEEHCLMVDAGPLCPDGFGPNGEAEQIGGGIAVVLDITARRRADLLAPARYDGFEEVFERSPIGTGLLDVDGRWLLVNRALCDITGYTSEELLGRRFDGIVHPEDAYNDDVQRERLLEGELPAYQVEKRIFDAAGETISAILSVSLVRGREGEPLHFIAQLQDISERKELEEHLRRLADHDPLTGLRNRRLFEHDLRLQVARAHRYGEVAGLMIVDVEGFRELNRRHGTEVGDETLRAISRALSRRLRETDLIARLGGDEFAVLLPHADEEGLAVVAEGLARVIPAVSIDLGAEVLHPTASVGYALITERSGSPRQIVATAERAMQAARRERA